MRSLTKKTVRVYICMSTEGDVVIAESQQKVRLPESTNSDSGRDERRNHHLGVLSTCLLIFHKDP